LIDSFIFNTLSPIKQNFCGAMTIGVRVWGSGKAFFQAIAKLAAKNDNNKNKFVYL